MSDLAEQMPSLVLPDTVLKPACQRCRWSVPDQGTLSCRRNPPQVTIVLVPADQGSVLAVKGAGQAVGLRPHPLAAFPFVNRDMWCGSFELAAAKMD